MNYADLRESYNHIVALYEHAYRDTAPSDKAIESYHQAKERAEHYADLAGDTEASAGITELIKAIKD